PPAMRLTAPAMSAETRRWVEAALAQRPRGFLTDIDGTLSAIAPTPDQARLYRGIRPLLRRLLDEFDLVAAISGRPALDARRLIGIPQMTYIGNHGMERLAPQARIPEIAPEASAFQAAIADTLHEARVRLSGQPGELLFENKGVTASIHYRLAPDPEAARGAIHRALDPLARRHQLRVTEGRMVIELRPPVDRDKGTSVRALVRQRALACALYLGDDRTDEDAFRALRELRAEGACVGIAVAVGHAEAPASLLDAADITLASIAEVPRFIRWVLRLLQADPPSQ
ncbi:MAG TPA: trehalose-phosphatase, partial [Ktedonobacterales bacterium]